MYTYNKYIVNIYFTHTMASPDDFKSKDLVSSQLPKIEEKWAKIREDITNNNSWEVVSDNDPRLVNEIQVSSLQESWEIESWHIQLKAIQPTVWQNTDDFGKSFGETIEHKIHPHIISYPSNQDVVDILPFFYRPKEDWSWDEIMVAINTSIRPTIVARKQLLPNRINEEKIEWGYVDECLWINFSGKEWDIDLKGALDRALMEKTGLTRDSSWITIAQNAYYTAVSSLAEIWLPKIVQVRPPVNLDTKTQIWTDYSWKRAVKYMSLQDLINWYFDDSQKWWRLIHLGMELARKTWTKIEMPEIPTNNTLTNYPEIESDIVTHKTLIGFIEWKLYDEKNDDGITHMTIEENNDLYDTSKFQKKKIATVTNVLNNGKKEEYPLEIVVRDTIDTIEVVPHFWHDGKLMMPFRAMLRPMSFARNLEPHPISMETKMYNIEWFAAWFRWWEQTKEDILESAEKILINKWWFEPKGNMTYINSSAPSIGVTPEFKHIVYTEIDPTKQFPSKVQLDFDKFNPIQWFIEVDELLRSADEWLIQDPSLVLHANILKQKYQYTSIEWTSPRSWTEEEYNELQDLMSKPLQSDLMMKIAAEKNNAPMLYQAHKLAMKRSPSYRKWISFVEQILWWAVQTEKMRRSEKDKWYFESSLSIYSPLWIEDVLDRYTAIWYLWHDNAHQPLWWVAIVDPDTWEIITTEDKFVYLHTYQEAFAVTVSDYLLPKEIWFETFEKFLWIKKCVWRTLEEFGIDTFKKALEVIIQMERDGVIPDRMLQHEAYQDPSNRDNIMRVIWYHPNDKKQSRDEYRYWASHPEVAKVKARFMHVSKNEEEVLSKMKDFDDMLEHYPEGNNSFKSYISSHINTNTTIPAMRAWVLKQYIVDSNIEGKWATLIVIDELIEQLYHQQVYIKNTRDMVTSMNYDDTNIKALRRIKHSKHETETLMAQVEKLVTTTPYITQEQRDDLSNNYFAWFQWFNKYEDKENKQRINDIEQENLKRAWVTMPLYHTIAD